MNFQWDAAKDDSNARKYGISFSEAQTAFLDKKPIIYHDDKHSLREERYYFVGKLESSKIATVRFSMRNGRIRIVGAGYWRKGKKQYDKAS
jgi:uncharacterized DUF497 family protein